MANPLHSTESRLRDGIAKENGTAISGAAHSHSLSGEDGPASTYLGMMGRNIATLAKAVLS